MPTYYTKPWWLDGYWLSGYWLDGYWYDEATDDTAASACVLGEWLITSDLSGDFSITAGIDGSWDVC